jgi:hypothetical protein
MSVELLFFAGHLLISHTPLLVCSVTYLPQTSFRFLTREVTLTHKLRSVMFRVKLHIHPSLT